VLAFLSPCSASLLSSGVTEMTGWWQQRIQRWDSGRGTLGTLFPTDHCIKCALHHFMPSPPPLSPAPKTQDRPADPDPANCCSSLKLTSICAAATTKISSSHQCATRAIFLTGKGARANGGGVRDGGALRYLFLDVLIPLQQDQEFCVWVMTMAERVW